MDGTFFEVLGRTGRVSTGGATRRILRRINNTRGIAFLARYIAHLQFGLGSVSNISRTGIGTMPNIINIIGGNNRCRIVVNGRMTTICSRLVGLNSFNNGRIGRPTTPTRRGGDEIDVVLSALTNIFAPLVPLVTNTNVVGTLLSILALFN